MDFLKHGMKGPSRPALAQASVPGVSVNRYSPVTNWNDDPFGDVFEPTPDYSKKKKPPPRPPPPKLKQPDIAMKPTHFIRKPTVLSALLSRKGKINQTCGNQQTSLNELNSDIFSKCERTNVQMGTLIDFSSPPSSPTFTTRSSSDGLSVDSFGSDATTSTNHHNALNGGNTSQAESGFEDDFDLFLSSRKQLNKDDTLEDFSLVDPFSPPSLSSKPNVPKKPMFSQDMFETNSSSSQYAVSSLKRPTIIRAKPARPKPPDNSALLKTTFGSNFPTTAMNVNTTTPIHKITNGFVDNMDAKPLSWDHEDSSDRESTPPMPTIPPPPPPLLDDDLPTAWPEEVVDGSPEISDEEREPYAVALFDYFTGHHDDLCFSVNSKIQLIRRVDNEWYYGRLSSGAEGLFPTNYVEVKVSLPDETAARIGCAVALYDFYPVQAGDLGFKIGDRIDVLSKISAEWYFGACNGVRGQFPVNYVQMS